MHSGKALLALSILLASCVPCFSQAGKAELFGTIQDPSGLGSAQAKVTGENQGTGEHFEVTTDGQGDYHLLGLDAGQYVLTVEKPGFRPYRQTGSFGGLRRIKESGRLDSCGARR